MDLDLGLIRREKRGALSKNLISEKSTHAIVFFVRQNSDASDRGGPPGVLAQKVQKNHQKMWFYKSCDTLTTIQLGEKTQLTKVVSPLKRFGGPLQTRWDNRNFWLKKQLKTALWRPPGSEGPQKKWKNAIFQKLRYFNHDPTMRKHAI